MQISKLATILATSALCVNVSAAVNWDWKLTSHASKTDYGQIETITIDATFENLATSTGNLTIPSAALFYTASASGIYNGVDGDGTPGQTAVLYGFLAALNLQPGQSSTIALESLIPISSVPVGFYSFTAAIEGSGIPRTSAVSAFSWNVLGVPQTPPVPEPSTIALFLAGVSLVAYRSRSKNRAAG